MKNSYCMIIPNFRGIYFPQKSYSFSLFQNDYFPQVGTLQIGGKYIFFPPLSCSFYHNSSPYCFISLFSLFPPLFSPFSFLENIYLCLIYIGANNITVNTYMCIIHYTNVYCIMYIYIFAYIM